MTGSISLTLAYLLGSIPFGYLLVRWQRGVDVRRTGSGSIGATNVMRSLGGVGFAATFLLDVGKGTMAVWLAGRLTGNDPRWLGAAAVAAVVGHCYPVWLGFRGGKGVATGVGVFIGLAPLPVVMVLGIFVVLLAIFRYVSLGSIIATAAFPFLVHFVNHAPRPITAGAAGGALLIIAKHYANIQRLIVGTERRVGKGRPAVNSKL